MFGVCSGYGLTKKMRTLATHRCGPVSIIEPGVMCAWVFLLLLTTLTDVFSVYLIFLLSQKLRHKFQILCVPRGFQQQSNPTYLYYLHIFFVLFSFGKVGLMLIMLLLYWWFCHKLLIKGPIRWEKIPNESKKNDMSRAWFTAKEDSIHIKTMTFCFWCVYCRRGAPRKKRATVFASKPNPRRDLIFFRFYIYSDNKDSMRVSNCLRRSLFWFERKASTKCNRLCQSVVFNRSVLSNILPTYSVWYKWVISTDNWL